MTAMDDSFSEKREFFERISMRNTNLRGASAHTICRRRPLSEASFTRVAPEKPKRTFQHNFDTNFYKLERRQHSAMSTNREQRTVSAETEAGNTDNEVNSITRFAPIKKRSEQNLAEESIKPARIVSRNELFYGSSPDISDSNQEETRIRRRIAFKKPPRTSVEGKELSASKYNSTLQGELERRASRAQIVRRSTHAHNRKLAEFHNSECLFQFAILIKILEECETDGTKSRKPKVTFCYPKKASDEYSNLAELFYPDFSHTQAICEGQVWSGDEEYMLTLTNHTGVRQYAYCVKYLPSRKKATENMEIYGGGLYPVVLAIVSPVRNSMFYMDLTRAAYSYTIHSQTTLNDFFDSVYKHPYPKTQGANLVVLESLGSGLIRRLDIKNHGLMVGKEGVAAMISRLTPEITVCLVAALLAEQRILIAGNSVGDTDIRHPSFKPTNSKNIGCSTTRIVQMLEALIRPLPWPHTFIPIVPDNLIGLCDNPTPYLMGMLRSNLNKVKELIIEDVEDRDMRQSDFVFVDIDTGLINPTPLPLKDFHDQNEWRTENALCFCERVGMPRKLSSALLRYLKEAISNNQRNADKKVEEAILKWYARLFGHYRFVGAHFVWDDESKKLLIDSQPVKAFRPYLAYLCETSMFEEWIKSRATSNNLKGEKDSVSEENLASIPGSQESLNSKLDSIWQAEFERITPTPINNIVTKISAFMRFKRS